MGPNLKSEKQKFKMLFSILFLRISNAQICGGRIDGTNGEIISPGYPRRYADSQNCNWLSAAAGEQGFDNSQVYQVQITDMDIEADTLCRWDSLEIIFGNGYRTEKFCGNDVPNL